MVDGLRWRCPVHATWSKEKSPSRERDRLTSFTRPNPFRSIPTAVDILRLLLSWRHLTVQSLPAIFYDCHFLILRSVKETSDLPHFLLVVQMPPTYRWRPMISIVAHHTEHACPSAINALLNIHSSTHRSGSSCFSPLSLSTLLETLRILHNAVNP